MIVVKSGVAVWYSSRGLCVRMLWSPGSRWPAPSHPLGVQVGEYEQSQSDLLHQNVYAFRGDMFFQSLRPFSKLQYDIDFFEF